MKKIYRTTKRACYTGYVVQAVVNNLLPVFYSLFNTKFAISLSLIASIAVMNFGTQLVVDILAASLADKIGYRKCLVAAHLLSGTGLLLLGVLPEILPNAYAGLVICVILNATGSGLIEVLISPLVDAIPSDNSASEMSFLHSFYCWGQLLTVGASTLLLAFLGEDAWFVIPMIWSLIPFINIFVFMKAALPDVTKGEEKPMKTKSLFRTKGFLVFFALMLCAGAAEMAMAQWASFFAEKGLGISKLNGDLIGVCGFALLMGAGRIVFGLKVTEKNIYKCLLFCASLAVVCYLAVGLVSSRIVSVAGCAVCGFAVSIMWPGVFSAASKEIPSGGTRMFAFLAVAGDVGCMIGPLVAGVISDRAGAATEQAALRHGFLAVSAFPIIMVVLLTGRYLVKKGMSGK